ncbi:hypothetical protein TRFO_05400 [Tritrichomonas foetus]|uniref:Uncharacterized protein n=1 Tax=Tritrichomonas foetus TaxID=1144522 RepID=A0A1J4KAN6_9EUKA|nr:hypothetical protein TRFO_05400 [Tritrichomonas foetus]|eukprot:OHT06734.1 hypothetical protein TRFO_05400 [Tritrichomonas foetus]
MNVAFKRAQQLGFLLILLVSTLDFLILWNPLFMTKQITSEFFNTAYDDLLTYSIVPNNEPPIARSAFIAITILSEPSIMITEIHNSWGQNFEATSMNGQLAYFVDSPIDENLRLFPIVEVRPPIFPLNTTRLCRMELEATKYFLSSTTAGWMLIVHERTWVNYTSLMSTLDPKIDPNIKSVFYASADQIKGVTLPQEDGGWVFSREFARRQIKDGEIWMKTCTGETSRSFQLMEMSRRQKSSTIWTKNFIGIPFNDYEMEGLLTKNMSRIEVCVLPLLPENSEKKGESGNFVRKMNHIAVWNIPSRKFFLKVPKLIPTMKNLGYSYVDGKSNICAIM